MNFSKNKDARLTYDQLMNSQFMRHPSHSQVVHKIFSPWIIGPVILVFSMAYVGWLVERGEIIFIYSVLTSWFSMALYFVIIWTMTGHGVRLHELTSKWLLFGIPGAIVLVFPVCFVGILILIVYGYNSPGEDGLYNRTLGISLLFGFMMMLLCWRFHGYYETWYADQESLRFYLKSEGYSEEEIGKKIQALKNKGMMEYLPDKK